MTHGEEEEVNVLVHECHVAIWIHLASLREGATKGERVMWVVWQCRSAILRYRRYRRLRLNPLKEVADFAGNDAMSADVHDFIEELAENLTERQRQMLDLILQGYPTRDIARILGIKPESVSVERNRIIHKMRRRSEEIESINNKKNHNKR